MKHPHWIVLCAVTGVLSASACGDGDESDGSHAAAGSGGDAAAGMGAESGAGGSNGSSGSNGAGGSSAGEEAGGAGTSTHGGEAAGGDSAGNGGGGAASAAGDAGSTSSGGAGGSGECHAVEKQQELATGVHVATCSDITYATNPPSSGQHYGVWADYGVYDFALPRGYWVHNLEHGSVVVTYSCQDCAAEVAAAKAWLAGLEPDSACSSGPPRVLLLPDPALDVRWAASSWGFTLRADCFEPEAFSDFYVKHAGQPPAPEAQICATGTDFRASGACGIK